ncbi:MAG: CDP-alcohol phosphatidyltransferase family protein [Methanomicrobia archaeon]|nr:CDP-alcohol phosphatidyltransferase family protein [Methanomicrobia archaeon]
MNSSKPTDGIISKHINRKVSIRISKILLKTGITPNHVSIITFLIALSAAFMFLRGNIILGGILTQLTSIIDGVDGEIARMKNMQTKF